MEGSTNRYIFESEPSESVNVSSDVKIKVVNDLAGFRDFFKVPWVVYQDNKYWVPPFWDETERFFRSKELFWTHSQSKLFVAYKKDKAVGRIAAFIDDSYVSSDGKKTGFFGYFECINDSNIALALLNEAEKWLKNKGVNLMQGPVNGRADVGSGFVIKGFDIVPYLLGHYSNEYYNNFAKEFQMEKSKDLFSYQIDLNKPIPESVLKSVKSCEKKGVKIRTFDRRHFKKEMDWWTEMFMDVFSEHWGFTEVSNDEVRTRFGIRELKWIVDPKLFFIAEVDGKPIGFRWSLPDYNMIFKDFNGKLGIINKLRFLLNKYNVSRGRFIVMGFKKEFRGMGLGTCMNCYTLNEMKKRGYLSAEYGWIDENNLASCKAGEKIGGELYKIYRVYEKNI
jgi:hypothetical protein